MVGFISNFKRGLVRLIAGEDVALVEKRDLLELQNKLENTKCEFIAKYNEECGQGVFCGTCHTKFLINYYLRH